MFYARIIDHEAADFVEGYQPEERYFTSKEEAEEWLEANDLEYDEDWGWSGRVESWVTGAVEER